MHTKRWQANWSHMSSVEVSDCMLHKEEPLNKGELLFLLAWLHFMSGVNVYCRPHSHAMLAVGMETGLSLWNADPSVMQSR